jgi:hypothetical protein
MSPWSPLHGGLDVDILSTLKNTTTKHRTQVTMPKINVKLNQKKRRYSKHMEHIIITQNHKPSTRFPPPTNSRSPIDSHHQHPPSPTQNIFTNKKDKRTSLLWTSQVHEQAHIITLCCNIEHI